MNNFRAFIVAWPKSSLIIRVCVGMNKSVVGEVKSALNGSNNRT